MFLANPDQIRVSDQLFESICPIAKHSDAVLFGDVAKGAYSLHTYILSSHKWKRIAFKTVEQKVNWRQYNLHDSVCRPSLIITLKREGPLPPSILRMF